MKRHLSPIITLGVVFAFIVSATFASDPDDQCDYMPPPEFAWDGELNPNEFDKWETLSVQSTFDPLVVFGFIKNPDETSPIEIVVMAVAASDGTMLGYRYFKDGQPYLFTFDSESNKYVEYKFTEEEIKGCMKCHQDKLVPQEAI